MANTLTTLTRRNAVLHPQREAYYTRTSAGVWQPVTWTEFDQQVSDAACALETLGLKPGQRVALFSANRAEDLVVDFACYANRGVPVSIYSTSSAEQVEYILNDTGAEFIFTGDNSQLETLMQAAPHCPKLRHIVTFDATANSPQGSDSPAIMSFVNFMALGSHASAQCRAEVDSRRASAQADDIATLIYTSGTTGEPKGAILPHSCFNATLDIHKQRLTSLSDADTSVSFLPLSHIFEKAWTYFCLYTSLRVYINEDPREIQRTLLETRPSCMCSVPRFWEKVYTGVQEKIASMSVLQKALVRRALTVGRKRNLHYKRLGLKAPARLEMAYRFYHRHVFLKLQKAVGIDNGNIFPTAGAPLDPKLVEFFHSCGINVMIGYGLSETTATVTCFPSVGYQIGSVGTTIPEVQVKIGQSNEILVKGPITMTGYYNKPDETARAFTHDGWLRTGDAGRIDPATGALVLTERLKDLFKTSNGKYIAPQAIESRLGSDKYIEQVAVIGDQRKYVTAIIIPAFEALKEYARKKKIRFGSIDDLVNDSHIRSMIESRINKLQQGLAGFEKIKKFTLLPREFTMENGELTNTLKIRRPVIYRHYASVIEAMYA